MNDIQEPVIEEQVELAAMNPKAYLLGFWMPPVLQIGLGLGKLLASFGFYLGIGLGPLITFSIFSRNAWLRLEPRPGRPKPNEAWLLLIPFVNIFWQYRVIYPLGRAIQEDARKLNLNDLEIGDAFSTVLCHFVWIFLLFAFLSAFSSIFFLFAIIWWVLWIILANVILCHYVSVINVIISERRKLGNDTGVPNPTSDGIRQPADGSPKPSM